MGRLRRQADGDEVRVVNEFRIGRAPLSELQLTDARISAQHALLRFTAGGWALRDLASTNGTWVDGRRLAPGESCALRSGALLAFGHAGELWELVDAAPPTAALIAVGQPRAIVETSGGLLAIPDGDAPEAVLLREHNGTWKVEDGSGEFQIADGETFVVGGQTYLFSNGGLTGHETERVEPGNQRWSFAQSRLRFCVSRDEEEVQLELIHGLRCLKLENRAHFYLLLVLARSRLRDELEAGMPASLSGWCFAEELSNSLKVTRVNVNLFVHRLRRDFAAVGVVDPGSVIQRRQRLGELRIGLPASQIDVQLA